MIHWRPISLFNVGYKILTKILTTKSRVFNTIIHPDQNGFLPDRYMG